MDRQEQPDAAFCRSLDLCECGDYRRDHNHGKGFCLLNRDHKEGQKCYVFVFARHASQNEIAFQWGMHFIAKGWLNLLTCGFILLSAVYSLQKIQS